MSRALRQDLFPDAPVTPYATRAMQALRLGEFKEAIRLFKQLAKQDDRPEWRDGLAHAYAARADQLAGRGMFEEAQILLDNTAAADGTVRDPLLYVRCLLKRGQHQKAAEHALKYVGTGKVPAAQAYRLADVTAALSLAVSWRRDGARDPNSERGRWFAQAETAQQALAAWLEGKPHEEIDRLLANISLRSDFKAVRLLLKALIIGGCDPDRARRLIEGIPEDSAFATLRMAVEAALAEPAQQILAGGGNPSRTRQSFILQINGLADSGSHSLAELLKAESGGPSSLFALLIKRAEADPTVDVRNACLNLLPRIPDRFARFEKTFGPLSAFDRSRMLALAAEIRCDWGAAERHWCFAIQRLEHASTPQAKLSGGVICRHLAELAARHEEIGGDGGEEATKYFERSRRFDPDYLPTFLKLTALYRNEDAGEHLDGLLEDGLARFPGEGAVLRLAVDRAAEKKDLGQAVVLAERLLALDPINAAVRQRIIDLRLACARQLMRSQHADLAYKELAAACEVELPQAPSFGLRIAQGLVGLQLAQDNNGRGSDAQGGNAQGGTAQGADTACGRAEGRQALGGRAEARLREGVALAGGGVCGWFRALLEHAAMHGAGDAALLRRELANARKSPPSKEAMLSIAAAVDGEAARENAAPVMQAIRSLGGWLMKGSGLDWCVAEFRPVAEMLRRAEAYRLLAIYAKRGVNRHPGEALWRLYQLVAHTRGDSDQLSARQARELVSIAERAEERESPGDARLIWEFLDSAGNGASGADADGAAEERIIDAMEATLSDLSPQKVRRMVAKHGAAEAVDVLADKIERSPLGTVAEAGTCRRLAKEMVESVLPRGGRRAQSRERPSW